MKIEDGVVLQPYGKDEVSINFMVTPMGKWIFGPSDVNNIKVLKENATIFNFVRFKAKNPKYYVRGMDTNFKIKPVTDKLRPRLTHDTTGCKSIFFFMFYEPREDFVAMNYTTIEKEFDVIDSKMNILSAVSFYGSNFDIISEDWDHGVTVDKEKINFILEKMKNEPKLY